MKYPEFTMVIFLIVNLSTVLANLILGAYFFKLYTEIMKEYSQRNRR